MFKGAGATSILDAITSIVKQSDYIQTSLKSLYKNDSLSSDEQESPNDTATTDTNKKLKWINVATEVINLGFDTARNDWAYKITYIVQSYDAPVVNVVQAGNTPLYYGPSKRYDYWFTGKNSEILKFELTYNSLYTTIGLGNLEDQTKVSSPVPTMVGQKVNEQNQGRLGQALQSQNSFVNYMNDASAYASATITILGDPDYLVDSGQSSLNEVYDKFYGSNGFTLNPNGGQIFIEIDFKEAEDYDHTKGVLSINDSILFWEYPQEYKTGPNAIKGIAFNISHIRSSFRGGKFEQVLTCVADFWPKTIDSNESDSSSSNGGREQLDASGRRTAASDLRLHPELAQNGQVSSTNAVPGTTPSVAGAGRGGNAFTDSRSLLYQKNNQAANATGFGAPVGVGFVKAPATPLDSVSSAGALTNNAPTTNLNTVQVANTTESSQVTSPTGGNGYQVADGDALGDNSSTNTYQPPNTVNTTDAGRE